MSKLKFWKDESHTEQIYPEIDESNILLKDNTAEFIPIEDYNPATKKYVDDSIADIAIPTKTSQLTNDSDFISKNVNDLTNYYNKSNTYNKTEIDALIGGSTECLIVTLDVDPHSSATTASHSPAEIRQALLEGIPAYLKSTDIYSSGEGPVLFIPIHYAETYGLHPESNIAVATFVDTISSEGIEYIQTVTIKEDKSVEIKTTTVATDSMLQEELGGYLSKTNTTEYTPSADYHPATKKYVDDHAGLANIIKTGITDPNTETVGNFVGQIYCNTRKDTAYQLVSITKIDGETYYNWTKLVRGNDKVTSLSSNSTDEQYPTAKAVKDYVDNVPNIVLDGPEVKMNYKVDGKDVYAKKFTLGTGTTPGKQKSFDLTKFGFTADNHNKISYECTNHWGYQLPNITGDGWSQYGWLNGVTVYKIKNGDLIDTTGDTLYLTIYYTKTTE